MSVVKVIEVIAKSPEGFRDAVERGVAEAAKSVRNITSVYVKEHHCNVANDQISEYKVCLKVSFLVEG